MRQKGVLREPDVLRNVAEWLSKRLRCRTVFGYRKSKMKIEARDVVLLAIGFFIGAVVTVVLITTPTRPLNEPASSVGASRTALAAALPPYLLITNVQWEAPPVYMFSEMFIDFRTDLIDARYQPDIKLNDLK